MNLEYVPDAFITCWNDEEVKWAKDTYYSETFTKAKERFFELDYILDDTPRSPERSAMLEEQWDIRDNTVFS